MCQRAHGAAYVTWLGCAEDSVVVDSRQLVWYRSSDSAERGFCRQCGSTLFFRSGKWPGELHIARACIEGPVDREPEVNAFHDTHVSWGDASAIGTDRE